MIRVKWDHKLKMKKKVSMKMKLVAMINAKIEKDIKKKMDLGTMTLKLKANIKIKDLIIEIFDLGSCKFERI